MHTYETYLTLFGSRLATPAVVRNLLSTSQRRFAIALLRNHESLFDLMTVCVCMYVCMYGCMCVYCVVAEPRVFVWPYDRLCMYVRMYVCIGCCGNKTSCWALWPSMHVCMYALLYNIMSCWVASWSVYACLLCMCTHTHTHTHTSIVQSHCSWKQKVGKKGVSV